MLENLFHLLISLPLLVKLTLSVLAFDRLEHLDCSANSDHAIHGLLDRLYQPILCLDRDSVDGCVLSKGSLTDLISLRLGPKDFWAFVRLWVIRLDLFPPLK